MAASNVRGSFHEDTKELKGLGTSPFGPLGLTPYPRPLRFPFWQSCVR